MSNKYHYSFYKWAPILIIIQFLDQFFKEKPSLVVRLDSEISDLICTIQQLKASKGNDTTSRELIFEIEFFVGDSIF